MRLSNSSSFSPNIFSSSSTGSTTTTKARSGRFSHASKKHASRGATPPKIQVQSKPKTKGRGSKHSRPRSQRSLFPSKLFSHLYVLRPRVFVILTAIRLIQTVFTPLLIILLCLVGLFSSILTCRQSGPPSPSEFSPRFPSLYMPVVRAVSFLYCLTYSSQLGLNFLLYSLCDLTIALYFLSSAYTQISNYFYSQSVASSVGIG